MTPLEYKEFCESTYVAPSHVNRDNYLTLLLIEERGEVASLHAKAMRDGHEVDRERLLKELGDVLWCCAMRDDGVDDWPAWWGGRYYAPVVAIECCNWWKDALDLCISLGFDPEEVARVNVEKLKSRQARGVLHGSGDER